MSYSVATDFPGHTIHQSPFGYFGNLNKYISSKRGCLGLRKSVSESCETPIYCNSYFSDIVKNCSLFTINLGIQLNHVNLVFFFPSCYDCFFVELRLVTFTTTNKKQSL